MGNQKFRVAVIRGDGIGVDVTDATLAVVDAARARVGGFELEYESLLAGAGYFAENGVDVAPGTEEARGSGCHIPGCNRPAGDSPHRRNRNFSTSTLARNLPTLRGCQACEGVPQRATTSRGPARSGDRLHRIARIY